MISNDKERKHKLLTSPNACSAFVQATAAAACSYFLPSGLTTIACSLRHENFHLFAQIAFNCFAKNELKRLNSRAMPDEPPVKVMRKVCKLTSKVSGK